MECQSSVPCPVPVIRDEATTERLDAWSDAYFFCILPFTYSRVRPTGVRVVVELPKIRK